MLFFVKRLASFLERLNCCGVCDVCGTGCVYSLWLQTLTCCSWQLGGQPQSLISTAAFLWLRTCGWWVA